jgi:flagellar hook-associated protein 3 FlgL
MRLRTWNYWYRSSELINMDLRVTTQVQVNNATDNLRTQSDSIANLQEQIQTGLRINKPSDDPLAAATIIQNNAQDSQLTTYLSNISDATSTLNNGVSTLTSVSNLLTQARQIALQGADSSTSGNEYTALASQVNQLLNQAISTSNSTFDGHTLFGGTATQQPAFVVSSQDSAGKATAVTYQGATQPAQAPINSGETVDTNYAGNGIFQGAGSDVFQSLITLRDNLTNAASGQVNSAALNQSVADVQNAQNAVLGTVGEMSAHLQNLSAMQSRLQDVQTQLKAHIGDLQSADLAQVILDLQSQQNLYTATLATSAHIFDQNLLDYVK